MANGLLISQILLIALFHLQLLPWEYIDKTHTHVHIHTHTQAHSIFYTYPHSYYIQ